MRCVGTRRPRPARGVGWTVVVATLTVAACGDEPARGQAAYCDVITKNADALRAPVIATADDIEATIDLYRKVEASAPLSVAEEWVALLANVETASSVDPSKPESVQAAADSARRSTPAAARAAQVTRELCGVDLASSLPAGGSTSPSSGP
jgi:hypothetical protein